MSPAEILEIDQHLDAVLRAAGSALRHYSMQKSLDDMRAAMRAAMAAAVAQRGDHFPDVGEKDAFAKLLAGERALSDAYLRLREILGAMDAPDISTPEAMWAYVEDVARLKVASTTDCDAAAVIAWANTPGRKPANLAFTAGAERQAAYWIEWAQQGQDSEPIGGQCKFDDQEKWGSCSVEHVREVLANQKDWDRYQVRFIYAAPPKREPLSYEQIERIYIAQTSKNGGGNLLSFAKEIERAHGIGGQS